MYEINEDGKQLEHASQFEYLGFVLGMSGIGGAKRSVNMMSGRKVAAAYEC